jgi:hypothetical protein
MVGRSRRRFLFPVRHILATLAILNPRGEMEAQWAV